MATTAIAPAGSRNTVNTTGAGAVTIGGATSGHLAVNTSGAGAVTTTGNWAVNTSRAGSVTATGVINTLRAGSVAATSGVASIIETAGAGSVVTTAVTGDVDVNTTGAGAVTVAEVLNNTGTTAIGVNVPGGVNSTTGDTSGEDYVKGNCKAAALHFVADCVANAAPLLNRLFGVATAAHGEKLVLLLAGAAEMHARGSNGRRILYASLATLLLGAALHGSSTFMLKK